MKLKEKSSPILAIPSQVEEAIKEKASLSSNNMSRKTLAAAVVTEEEVAEMTTKDLKVEVIDLITLISPTLILQALLRNLIGSILPRFHPLISLISKWKRRSKKTLHSMFTLLKRTRRPVSLLNSSKSLTTSLK